MATGTTSDHVLKRNELIMDALWHVRALPPDGRVSTDLLRRAIRILNNLIRQEDIKLTGDQRALWAFDSAGLFLRGDSHVYRVADGVRPDAQDVSRITARANGGDETDVTIIPQERWDGFPNKNEIGDPLWVYIKKGRLTKDNIWYVIPVPSGTADAPSNIIGQDNKSYECIQAHTSDDDTKPPGGQSARLYWQPARSDSATQWVTATAYVNGDMLYYTFKRPLFDFASPYDNPDMPQGWDNYFTYKLALSLSVGKDLDEKDMRTLRVLLRQAEDDIAPSRTSQSTDFHNKVVYF